MSITREYSSFILFHEKIVKIKNFYFLGSADFGFDLSDALQETSSVKRE